MQVVWPAARCRAPASRLTSSSRTTGCRTQRGDRLRPRSSDQSRPPGWLLFTRCPARQIPPRLLPRCPAACGHGVSLFSPRPVGWDGGGRAGASRQGAVVCFLWDSRAGVEIVAIAAVRRRDSCHLGALARSDGAPVVNGILLCAFLSCLRVIV